MENQENNLPKSKVKIRILPKLDENCTVLEVATKQCPSGWIKSFENAKEELIEVSDMIEEQKKSYGSVYPLAIDTFTAFNLTPLNKVKVVIVGQDPYPTTLSDGSPRATGLSFSVKYDDQIPSSLINIYKELQNTITDYQKPNHGNLKEWALQGILMLNMCLTVRAGSPGSHGEIWKGFIVKILKDINEQRPGTIFVLWGREAQKLQKYTGDNASILTAAHPSGLSATRGFFGCNHFNKINEMLEKRGEKPINWQITST